MVPHAGADRAGMPPAVYSRHRGRVDVREPEHHARDYQQHRQDYRPTKLPELTTTVAASTDPYTADE
jgi:hypothetical protein